MRYRIRISPKAERELRAMTAEIRREIAAAIDTLQDNPRPHDVKRLQGHRDIFRKRVGQYRVLYRIRDDILEVLIVRIGNRAEVYRQLDRL